MNAQLIWYADPVSSPSSLFKVMGTGNVAPPSTISTVTDATRGTVWRFHKPSGSNRCETHGIKVNGTGFVFQNHTVYYLGWWTKLTSTADNNAIFQWKSYDNHIQNFPFVLKMRNGQLQLMQRQPEGVETILLNKPFSANTWYHIVIGVRVDDELHGGWVELYLNGVQQTFTTGTQRFACRTLDSHNCPKWGIYGRSDLTITDYLDDIKVGHTYADVAMTADSSTPDIVTAESGTASHKDDMQVQNPLKQNAVIKLTLAEGGKTHLAVYDQMGRQVAIIVNERRYAGIHSINFDASRLAAGTYFLKLTRDGKRTTRQIVKE